MLLLSLQTMTAFWRSARVHGGMRVRSSCHLRRGYGLRRP